MTTHASLPAAPAQRPNFGFSVEGLAPREELLFKSLVRLLSHCTQHKWFYTPERGAEQLDLRVVCDSRNGSVKPLPLPDFQAILMLSAVERNQPGFLTLPLRASVLEAELNRLGALIESTRAAAVPGATTTADASPAQTHQMVGDRPFNLISWPPTPLLGSPARLRMATLLVGKPVTLTELAQKTGQPLPLCIEFVNDLWRANLLIDGPARPTTSQASTSQVTGPVSRAVTTASTATHKPKAISQGLLTRIRSRLGI